MIAAVAFLIGFALGAYVGARLHATAVARAELRRRAGANPGGSLGRYVE